MPQRLGYLVLSDLHLGEGRDPNHGRVSPKEDFLFDHAFSDFVDRHLDEADRDGVEWTLILNGDLVDFLQVTASPGNAELREDPRYGLKAGRLETRWKLDRVAMGHEEFFRALARFAERFPVVVVAGNHDIELVYPEVQERLGQLVASHLDPGAARRVRENLRVEPWCFFDGTVYAEHGHRFDPVNSFQHQLDPRLPESAGPGVDDIELPMGSLFVRYLFNRVESEVPYADNLKPATRFLRWYAANHPVRSLRFLFSDGREMMRRLRRKSVPLPESAYGSRQAAHRAELGRMAERIAGRTGWTPAAVREMLGELDALGQAPILRKRDRRSWRVLRWLVGPWRTPVLLGLALAVLPVGFVLALAPLFLPNSVTALLAGGPSWLGPTAEAVRWLFVVEVLALLWWRRRRGGDPDLQERLRLRQAAVRIRNITAARFVVMGHTHDSDLFRVGGGGEYFNSGTWTRIFGEAWAFGEEKEFNYIRILESGAGWKGWLMRWSPDSGRGRLAYLFREE